MTGKVQQAKVSLRTVTPTRLTGHFSEVTKMLSLILSLIYSEDRISSWEHQYEYRPGKF
jgi:hypothetical protein